MATTTTREEIINYSNGTHNVLLLFGWTFHWKKEVEFPFINKPKTGRLAHNQCNALVIYNKQASEPAKQA